MVNMLFINLPLISYTVDPKYSSICMFFQIIAVGIGQYYLSCEKECFQKSPVVVIVYIFCFTFGGLCMIYCIKRIYNLNMRLSIEAHKTYQDIKTHNMFQKELFRVYQALDEGIITVK